MAILKNITDNKGQITSYHRIAAYAVVYTGEKLQLNVNLASYTSEQYRDTEKADATKDLSVTSIGLALPLFESDAYTRADIYTAIMALPEFEGSEQI